MIGTHSFNTPALLFILLIFSFLVTFALKPVLGSRSPMQSIATSGKMFFGIILFMALFVIGFSYWLIYIPFNSDLLFETKFVSPVTVDFIGVAGSELFFEVDTGASSKDGTTLFVSLNGPNNWVYSKEIVVGADAGRKNDKYASATSISRAILNNLPSNGNYTLIISKRAGETEIRAIRVYQRNF
jgi:hypothetical protein